MKQPPKDIDNVLETELTLEQIESNRTWFKAMNLLNRMADLVLRESKK